MIKHIVMWKLKDRAEGADKAALDAYQDHPKHVSVKPFIGAVRLERQCMDYEA